MEEYTYGKLIVFEGIDGVGKTTLSQALTHHLSALGIPCESVAFPGKETGTLGRLVSDLHHAPHKFGVEGISPTSLQTLHVAAHVDAIEQRILPALDSGRCVVLDRYWWSTLVYGKAFGVDDHYLEAMIRFERLCWGKVKPSVVFLVDRHVNSEYGNKTTRRLLEEYDVLARREAEQLTIKRICNESSIEHALSLVTASLTGFVTDSSPPSEGERYTATPIRFPPDPSQAKPQVRLSSLSPAKPTIVYDAYWKFAAARQEIFFRKLGGCSPPWTEDPILGRYKFTNAYRASDRVSQYLIRHVIYEGDQSPDEVFFRVILFKIFNKVDTWELLQQKLGTLTYSEFSFKRYDDILTEARASGHSIYSAAYIMPSGKTSFGHEKKHQNHLDLIERMMQDRLALRIADAPSMSDAFAMIRSYPTVGDFLAYQFVTDLNYSEVTDFAESEFVVPGPGAIDGVHKCFSDLGGLTEGELIRLVTEHQEQEFDRLGVTFQSLWGRPLQLIDCQNLFCEIAKYARVAFPEFQGIGSRTRIKQVYRPSTREMTYWFPPKWGINHLIPHVEKG